MVAERGYAQVTGVGPADEKSSAIGCQPGAPRAGVEEKEKTEENEQRFAYAREYVAKEAELQKIFAASSR